MTSHTEKHPKPVMMDFQPLNFPLYTAPILNIPSSKTPKNDPLETYVFPRKWGGVVNLGGKRGLSTRHSELNNTVQIAVSPLCVCREGVRRGEREGSGKRKSGFLGLLGEFNLEAEFPKCLQGVKTGGFHAAEVGKVGA